MMYRQLHAPLDDKALQGLVQYLGAYRRSFVRNPGEHLVTHHYLDFFSGKAVADDENQSSERDAPDGPRACLGGTVRGVLGLTESFHRYHFLVPERQKAKTFRRRIEKEFPRQALATRVVAGDAASYLEHFIEGIKRHDQALVLLDPFTLPVPWSLVESLARTGKIDLGLLVPSSRILQLAEVNATWPALLNDHFGTGNWEEAFSSSPSAPAADLFGHGASQRGPTRETVAGLLLDRLRKPFPVVMDRPIPLHATGDGPVY